MKPGDQSYSLTLQFQGASIKFHFLTSWLGCFRNDFCVYNELDQIIVSVGLVPPKPNVFVDDVKHVLAIATPVEIILLAVCFDNGSIFGELSLHPSKWHAYCSLLF